jgi:6-pyruvoyltetrahydropterin/6-carboxytetrahydropterin synthase
VFELKVEVDFPAAHHLVGYAGDCARQHGHNWTIEVFVRSRKLDQVGMAVDFRLLKGSLRELVASWDHQDLNTLEDFRGINPTAEQIAKLAFERLSGVINGEDVWVDRITVWENDRCSATYFTDSRADR